MGQTLTNGIYLPDEGEVRCYAGLASNWTTLDAVVGGYNAHVANENIHITSAERSKWNNGVTQAYVLRYANTSLTALGTVAFSALDNTDNIKIGDKVLDSEGKLFALTAVDTDNSTATLSALLIDLSKDSDLSNYYTKGETDTLLNDKADDSDVLHRTGDESASGDKNFRGLLTTIPSSSLWPAVSNTSDDIKLLGRSVVHLEQLSSGRLTDLSGGAWNVVELGTGAFFFRNNTGTDIRYKHLDTGVVNRIHLVSGSNRFINDATPNQDNTYNLGSSSLRWRSINGINPGALGMPNLNNGIDISGYITVVANANKESLYTPPANGWISVALTRAGGTNMAVMLKQGNFASSGHNIAQENGTTTCNAMLPVKGGVQVSINSALADGIAFAYFYPCQGNV